MMIMNYASPNRLTFRAAAAIGMAGAAQLEVEEKGAGVGWSWKGKLEGGLSPPPGQRGGHGLLQC